MPAELPNIVHSCSWHGMIAAGLYSEWSGSVFLLQKGLHSMFMVSVPVDIIETDGKCLVVHVQCFCCY